MTIRPKLALGDRIGRLTIIGPIITKDGKNSFSMCRCDCGTEKLVGRHGMKLGLIQSCGCLGRERRIQAQTTHGLSTTSAHCKEYRIWASMRQRCGNSTNKHYAYYGGRGIAVCERWQSFENFYADMGVKPDGLSLDRKDNDQGYSKENCRWATRKEQMRNTRSRVYIEMNGERIGLLEACEKLGMLYSRIHKRMHKKKCSMQDAFDYYRKKYGTAVDTRVGPR